MYIDRTNYEEYFLDYLDGNLSGEMLDCLNDFLALNPDLKAELESLSNFQEIQDSKSFNFKEDLKKSPGSLLPVEFKNEDEFFIAKIENDLNESNQLAFEKYLKINPESEKNFQFLLKTKLQPDLKIVYPNKKGLKKKAFIPLFNLKQPVFTYLAIASVILILFFSINKIVLKQQPEIKEIATNDQADDTKKESDNNNSKKSDKQEPKSSKPTTNKLKKNVKKPAVNPIDKLNTPVISIAKNGHLPIDTINEETFSKINLNQSSTQLADILENTYNNSNNNLRIEYLEEISIVNNSSQNKSYTLDKYLYYRFRKDVLKEQPNEYENRKFSFWDVADASFRGLNRLLETDIKLNKEYDDSGNVVALAYNGSFVQFSTPLARR